MKKLLKNDKLVYSLAFVAGLIIGAIFYPTKEVTEEVKKKYEQQIEKILSEKNKLESSYKEKLEKSEQTARSYEQTTQQKINSLKTQITELQSKSKETYFKIVKPDGTIEERVYKESEYSQSTKIIEDIKIEFNTKISEIESRYEKVHKERVSELNTAYEKKIEEKNKVIEELYSKKTTLINPRKFSTAIGYLSNENYYGSVSYNLTGPFILNLHGQSDMGSEYAFGAGLGIGF